MLVCIVMCTVCGCALGVPSGPEPCVSIAEEASPRTPICVHVRDGLARSRTCVGVAGVHYGLDWKDGRSATVA